MHARCKLHTCSSAAAFMHHTHARLAASLVIGKHGGIRARMCGNEHTNVYTCKCIFKYTGMNVKLRTCSSAVAFWVMDAKLAAFSSFIRAISSSFRAKSASAFFNFSSVSLRRAYVCQTLVSIFVILCFFRCEQVCMYVCMCVRACVCMILCRKLCENMQKKVKCAWVCQQDVYIFGCLFRKVYILFYRMCVGACKPNGASLAVTCLVCFHASDSLWESTCLRV